MLHPLELFGSFDIQLLPQRHMPPHADHKHFHENLRIYVNVIQPVMLVSIISRNRICMISSSNGRLIKMNSTTTIDVDIMYSRLISPFVYPRIFAMEMNCAFFLDDDLGQEINQYEENDHEKSVHQIHHTSHGHVELSGNLGQILNINGGTDIFFINICNFKIREISAEAVFVHIKCFVEFLYWHKLESEPT